MCLGKNDEVLWKASKLGNINIIAEDFVITENDYFNPLPKDKF